MPDAEGLQALQARSAALRAGIEANQCRLEAACKQLQSTWEQILAGRPRREVLQGSVIGRLQARLDSQPVIEQAKGVLIAQGCDPDDTFDVLRRASQRTNVKVRDLAADIVDKAARRRQRQTLQRSGPQQLAASTDRRAAGSFVQPSHSPPRP